MKAFKVKKNSKEFTIVKIIVGKEIWLVALTGEIFSANSVGKTVPLCWRQGCNEDCSNC